MPLHGKCRSYSHGGSPSLDRLLGVSVAVFRTGRPLRVVDCTKAPIGIRSSSMASLRPQNERRRFGHFARAFREPVTRDDDVADYAMTQVIAEVFRAERFDGLICRSSFGTDRFNVALFDLDAAKPSN
jgi:hypothetical protein